MEAQKNDGNTLEQAQLDKKMQIDEKKNWTDEKDLLEAVANLQKELVILTGTVRKLKKENSDLRLRIQVLERRTSIKEEDVAD